jgi:hypothetical protein
MFESRGVLNDVTCNVTGLPGVSATAEIGFWSSGMRRIRSKISRQSTRVKTGRVERGRGGLGVAYFLRRPNCFRPSDRLAGWDSHPLEIADFQGILVSWRVSRQRWRTNSMARFGCTEFL